MDYASSILGLLPTGRRSIGVTQLLNKLETYLPPAQVDRIRDAYEFGAEAHEGQKRLSGEPYIAHPVAVADLLADLHMDAPTIIAAILHDVIEDTPTAKDEIAERFGADVAELVDGVSKLDHIQFRSRAEAQAESFRKMLLAMVRDIRVIMVKLADRTHNMRTLGSVPPAKRRTVARETLEIYAPIANRLGIHSIKSELEELGFKALYPGRHRIIEKALKRARGNQKQFVGKIADNLRGALEKAGVKGRVEGREKHLYSVYQKMRRKRAPLASIVDVFGFRIVVDSIDTCYRALGLVHGLYRPMPGRFKDYIAIPRINGYQSLHTTLFGPNGMPIEVQIRTDDMHRVAESGIAAHWQYKTGDEQGKTYRDRASEWLQHLMEMPHGGSSEEFMESVKLDLFPDKVYVFTPRGEIRRLPRNATAVDFAYSVHTDIGNHCVAAKVDRRLVPLRTPLRNGQTVEIITAKGATPNPAWVNFVVTAKARAAIRHYLKGLKHSEAVELGRRLLTQALADLSRGAEESAGGAAAGRRDGVQPRDAGRAVRADRPGRAPRAAGRAPPAAGRRRSGRDRAPARSAAAGDRGHGRHGRELRALLLPDPERSDHGVPVERPRRRHPPRGVRQPAQLPQAAGQVAVGHVAAERRPTVQRRSAHRRRESHGRARGDRLEHRDHARRTSSTSPSTSATATPRRWCSICRCAIASTWRT